jgi:prepilin-type processing-associated H-X9-DG protein
MVREGKVLDRLLTEKAAKRASVSFWSAYTLLIRGILLPVILPLQAKDPPQNFCLSNLRQIDLGLALYMDDHDDRMPSARWMEDLHPFMKNDEFFHDQNIEGKPFGYAMNRALVKADTASIDNPATTPSFFDSTAGVPDFVSRFRLPDPPRHGDHNNVAYLDGHAHSVKPK